MDKGNGSFQRFESKAEALNEAAKHSPRKAVFAEGEEIRLRNARFVVYKLGKHVLSLRLLPAVVEDPEEISRIGVSRLMEFYQDTHLEAAAALGQALPDVQFESVHNTLALLAAEIVRLKGVQDVPSTER